MFSENDLKQMEERGSSLSLVKQQIENFKSGFPPLRLEEPATPGNGIRVLSSEEVQIHVDSYQDSLGQKSIVKFVPASGAASRMFKALFEFVEKYSGSDEEYQSFTAGNSYPDVYQFFERLDQFAFYNDLKSAFMSEDETLEEAHIKRKFVDILKTLLEEDGLDYGSLPKGLLKFHAYDKYERTPAEEHMVEGAHYARDLNDTVRLHFTVSPEHKQKFETLIEIVRSKYESEHSVSFQISFSTQKSSTDTIAVDMENGPFRNADGSILFRPAGHGALIANLDEIDADIIFIKNIDNVVPDRLKDETYNYKKVLGGILLKEQQKIFEFLSTLQTNWNGDLEKEILDYLANDLSFRVSPEYHQLDDNAKKEHLINILNRPIRVAGMVANVGDPGGGPFWAKNSDGSVSLQIVETAQIDLEDPGQKSIFDQSTHFNPVDLACGVKDYRGNKFDLSKFVDPQTGFVTAKSKDGKELKAQELPGLWNGSMSNWVSIFVEVPAITFNPVKKVNDLLKSNHQPK